MAPLPAASAERLPQVRAGRRADEPEPNSLKSSIRGNPRPRGSPSCEAMTRRSAGSCCVGSMCLSTVLKTENWPDARGLKREIECLVRSGRVRSRETILPIQALFPANLP